MQKDSEINLLLTDKERRYYMQIDLCATYNKPVLSVKVNYPGISKNEHVSLKVFDIMKDTIISHFWKTIILTQTIISEAGPSLFCVIDQEAASTKLQAISIENQHPLGRLVDLDVFDAKGQMLSRTRLGFPPRKCYLCEGPAHLCVRSKQHSEKDLKQYFLDTYNNFIRQSF